MACHLDGGSCPHDFGFERGGGYLTSGSSSYAGGNLYALAGQYNGQTRTGFNYAGAGKSGAEYLSAMNPLGLASYAANVKYDAAYKGAGQYVGNAGQNSSEKNSQQAKPSPTIDNTVDQQSAIAVQRNFLEQMIQNARLQTTAQQQPQYRVMYS